MYLFKKIFQPEVFQGKYKKKNYFEGWYYKSIDENMENSLAIIPGISYDMENKDVHSFIQILDGKNNKTYYIRYPMDSFQYNENKFQVEIDKNYFSNKEMHLHIEDESIIMKGDLLFQNIIPFPKTLSKPGIMGPFSFVPFMECYHGVVNIHHDISGEIVFDDKKIDFTKGYGYIEKDWGKSFPESWIWFQSNHFVEDDISVMFSAAKIPWIGRSFLGFLSFLKIKDTIYNFSTYTKAKITRMDYHEERLNVILEDTKYKLEMNVYGPKGGLLKAPQKGLMHREILESIDGVVNITLFHKSERIIYQGTGINTGLEMVDEIFNYYRRNKKRES